MFQWMYYEVESAQEVAILSSSCTDYALDFTAFLTSTLFETAISTTATVRQASDI